MKKIITIISFGFILIIIHYCLNNNNYYKTAMVKENKSNMLSMMLETKQGSGEYELVNASKWPTEGYVFNKELSKCENGGELSWDDTKKIIVMNSVGSDKCYVYFDVSIKPLIEYVLSKYTGIQGENNIYYHDNSLTNSAKDGSYRYAGASDTTNNFVCFGTDSATCSYDDLYRIIGVFGDNYHGISGRQLIKLIKYDYNTETQLGTNGEYHKNFSNSTTYKGHLTSISSYYWDKTNKKNDWSNTALNTINLNTNFLNYLGQDWTDKIQKVNWKIGGNTYAKIISVTPSVAYQSEVVNPASSSVYNAKIGLIYVSDYYAANPSAWTLIGYDVNDDATKDYRAANDVNWMYMGSSDWTITRYSHQEGYAFYVSNDGYVHGREILNGLVEGPGPIRVTFFLVPTTTYVSGSGTISDPIRIN